VINLDSNDELAWVDRSAGGGEVLLLTAQGQAIRFVEDDARPMGLPAGGIGGIRLKARDRVAGGLVVPAGTRPDSFIATVTEKGWGKRTLLSEFTAQGRNGQGVVAAKASSRSGRVVGVALLVSDEALVCLLGPAGSHILAGDELPVVGRAALGKVLFAPPLGQQVTSVAAIPRLVGGVWQRRSLSARGDERPQRQKRTPHHPQRGRAPRIRSGCSTTATSADPPPGAQGTADAEITPPAKTT
jgi:DNA gyrase subunit A